MADRTVVHRGSHVAKIGRNLVILMEQASEADAAELVEEMRKALINREPVTINLTGANHDG